MLLNFGCGKLKGLGELMHTLNAPEGEVCLNTKHVGSVRFPMSTVHAALAAHLMCPLMFCPYV